MVEMTKVDTGTSLPIDVHASGETDMWITPIIYENEKVSCGPVTQRTVSMEKPEHPVWTERY